MGFNHLVFNPETITVSNTQLAISANKIKLSRNIKSLESHLVVKVKISEQKIMTYFVSDLRWTRKVNGYGPMKYDRVSQLLVKLYVGITASC